MAAETMSLLIVSPPTADRSLLKSLAEKLQIQSVRVVDDAVAGFAMLARERPTLTLADAHMRPTDGITFVREVRGTPIDNRDAPIWLATPNDPDALAIAAEAAGAGGVLALPVSEAGLLAVLTGAQASEQRAAVAQPGAARRTVHPVIPAATAERAKRAIERMLVEAEAGVSAWSRSGFDPNLVAVETALDASAQLAVRAGDAGLLRALTIALGVVDESRRSWDGDDRKIRAAINDVRARMGALSANSKI